MKKSIILLSLSIILFSGMSCFSQTPMFSVSPEKMNVLYIGVDNPLAIAVAGIPADKVTATISEGTITGSMGKFIARVSKPGEVTVTVSSGDKVIGTSKFRVKRVPDPVCYVGGKKGDFIISKAELTAIEGVDVKLENFDYDLKFDVVSFDITANTESKDAKGQYNLASETSNSNRLSDGQKRLIKLVVDKIYIENVKVKGPDGTIRSISGVTLTIK